MIAHASNRFLMTKSLNAFFSMSGKEQERGQRRKTAISRSPGRRNCKPCRLARSASLELDPGRRVVAGALAAADVAVHAGAFQPRRRRRVEQEMVDADAGVAGEGVPPIIPEGVDALVRMERTDRVDPILVEQPAILGARLGLHQRVVGPALGLV